MGQRVKYISDRNNSGMDRNSVPPKFVWVTASVPAFMVMPSYGMGDF